MTPHDFITKWRNAELKERSASQAHFLDLCRLLGIDDPVTADPKGDWFTFEKGATKTSGGEGWADVWRRNCFAWEYKGKRKDLKTAFAQLQQYAVALENPPLLIVSDMDRIQLHTNWTNTVQQVHAIALDELADAGKRDLLRWAFLDPERLRPAKTRQGLTEQAAGRFAALAMNLRRRGHDAHEVAHFVNRLIFCLFAEDVNLLPDRMFQRMIEQAKRQPQMFQTHAATLFAAMQSGGMVGFEQVEWFNGGLFDHAEALSLEAEDVDELLAAARLDWSEIDPSIMGTLFERGLDPDKRSQLGAHYTDRDKIMQIVEPVIIRPLLEEWQARRADIQASLDKVTLARSPAARTRAQKQAEGTKEAFLDRLANFRVLDPACGSGNFLYLALLALKDIEHRVNLDAEALGLPRGFPRIGPECVLGIELNPYAAELARVSVWIGEIQWMRRNGFEAARNPILRPLQTIENRDAVLAPDGTPANWPEADVVVGNPPFLGSYLMRGALGDEYVNALRSAYSNSIPATSDFVCYWFAQAAANMKQGAIQRFGLVATNSISQQQNRRVLDLASQAGHFFFALSDEPWFNNGASVRVSMVCLSKCEMPFSTLDGKQVEAISSDLRSIEEGVDLTKSGRLEENQKASFFGFALAGAFTIDGETARAWLASPNPHGRPNSDVLSPLLIGKDITGRYRDEWVINFSPFTEEEASLYELPFEHVREHVLPVRMDNRRPSRAKNWWLFGETRPSLRAALNDLDWYICTVERAKHRFFCLRTKNYAPDNRLVVFPIQSMTLLGFLSSRLHLTWATSMGSTLEDRPGYNTRVCFDTFPFPEGLTPHELPDAETTDPRAQKIAAAAARLNELRETWLNPAELVRRAPEVMPGYPDRILPVDDKAECELKKRTLTNLYNARPAWLDNAHRALDQVVAEAYGWGDDWRAGTVTDDEILGRLFRLNQQRAKA